MSRVKSFQAAVCAALCLVGVGVAQATSLIEQDLFSPGDKLLSVDTVTGYLLFYGAGNLAGQLARASLTGYASGWSPRIYLP